MLYFLILKFLEISFVLSCPASALKERVTAGGLSSPGDQEGIIQPH